MIFTYFSVQNWNTNGFQYFSMVRKEISLKKYCFLEFSEKNRRKSLNIIQIIKKS